MNFEIVLQKDRKLIGARIENILKERNISIEHFSRQCQMSKRTVYNILKGENYTISSLLTIIYVLDIKHEELLEGITSNTI